MSWAVRTSGRPPGRSQPSRCCTGNHWKWTISAPRAAWRDRGMPGPSTASEVELIYCVVNTSQRELLVRGLEAIARERSSVPFGTEVLVLDNGSRDGSARAAREHPAVDQTITIEQRRGKAINDSELLER